MAYTFVPAAADTYLLSSPFTSETKTPGSPREAWAQYQKAKTLVIAWAIQGKEPSPLVGYPGFPACVYPVTPQGMVEKKDLTFLYPDGGVRGPGRQWEDMNDWMDEQRRKSNV